MVETSATAGRIFTSFLGNFGTRGDLDMQRSGGGGVTGSVSMLRK